MNSMLMFQFAMIGFSIKHSDVPSLFVCKNQKGKSDNSTIRGLDVNQLAPNPPATPMVKTGIYPQ